VRAILVGLLVAVAAQSAAAKPRARDIDFFDGEVPPRPCTRARTWPDAKRCLDKLGTTSVLHDTDTAKVVTFVPKGTTATVQQVLLYANVEGAWIRTGFSGTKTPTNELLRVDKATTPNGDGVRIDMGTSLRTNLTLQKFGGSVRGILRRTFSQVCVPTTWSCRSFMTACEAYVHGKVYWTFHGEIVWHPTLGIRMRGETTAAGGNCKPSPKMLVDEDP
jgi:hypothetical protein